MLDSDDRGNERHPDSVEVDFTSIVNDHWTAVYRFLFRMTGNAHDASDLSQETFLRALDRIASYRAGTNARAWLIRIASNAFFDVWRRRQRSGTDPLQVDPPDSRSPLEPCLEVAEQAQLARVAMESLSELTRMVFHLRVDEDLSYREIADIAGTTEQAARWHMRQARVKLMKALGETGLSEE